MNFINKLERKYGKYGIPNLTMYIIGCYVLGYVLMMFNPRVMSMLSLNVTKILHGQIWRLVTWVIYPPSTGGLFWFLLAVLFFYYPIGTSLERTWGTFRYTLYMLSGVVFTVIAAFILHFMTGGYADVFAGSIFTTYYISMSVFLAYAVIYSEAQILLYFVIPIKMKWMAIFYVVIIGYDVINYLRAGMWFMVVPIVASLLNFILFFFGTRDMSRYNPKEVRRKQEFKKAMAGSRVTPSKGGVSKHKCAVCGRTELDDPNLEFRFCSKCNGNYEYCQDHLFTHTHVK